MSKLRFGSAATYPVEVRRDIAEVTAAIAERVPVNDFGAIDPELSEVEVLLLVKIAQRINLHEYDAIDLRAYNPVIGQGRFLAAGGVLR